MAGDDPGPQMPTVRLCSSMVLGFWCQVTSMQCIQSRESFQRASLTCGSTGSCYAWLARCVQHLQIVLFGPGCHILEAWSFPVRDEVTQTFKGSRDDSRGIRSLVRPSARLSLADALASRTAASLQLPIWRSPHREVESRQRSEVSFPSTPSLALPVTS